MEIVKKEWNDDLVGYCCELDNGKYFQVQFDLETNRLNADYNEYSPVLDTENEYGLDLSDDEIDELKELISSDNEFINQENAA